MNLNQGAWCGQGHKLIDCNVPSSVECINCKDAGKTEYKHSTMDQICPFVQEEFIELNKKYIDIIKHFNESMYYKNLNIKFEINIPKFNYVVMKKTTTGNQLNNSQANQIAKQIQESEKKLNARLDIL